MTQAIEIYRETGYRDGLVESLLEVALVHRAEGRKGRALMAVARAFTEAQRSRSEVMSADCRLVRGELGTGSTRVDVDQFVTAKI